MLKPSRERGVIYMDTNSKTLNLIIEIFNGKFANYG